MRHILCLILLLIPLKSYAINLKEAINAAFNNSPDLLIEKNKLYSAQNNKNSMISGYLPNISISYQRGIKQDIRGDDDDDEDFGYETNKTISLTQPIFNGFKTSNNIKQGEYEYLKSKAEYKVFTRDLALRIINIYLELDQLNQTKEILKTNIDLYKNIMQRIDAKANFASNNEIIDNKVAYNLAIKDYNQQSKEFAILRNELALLTFTEIDEIAEFDIEFLEFNYDELIKQIEDNAKIKQKYYELLAYKSRHKSQIAEFSPTIDLKASHNKQTDIVYLSGEDLETKSILLDVTIPIFEQGNRFFNAKQTKLDVNIKEQEYNLTLMQVKQELLALMKNYNFHLNDNKKFNEIYQLQKEKLAKIEESLKLKAIDQIGFIKAKIEKNNAAMQLAISDLQLHQSFFQLLLLIGSDDLVDQILFDKINQ